MANTVFDLAAKLTLDSSSFESGLNKAKGIASGFGGAIGTGLKVAGAAIGAATTAIIGFGAASVKTGMSFDKSMSQVTATMGMSTAEMEQQVGEVDLAWGKFSGNLREYAQEMGANTQYTASQAADALNYMALAGYDAQKSMEMLPNVMNLAAAGAMDLALASDMITDTETAFGLTTKRTGQMVDEMAKAASTGNTNVQQLGEAFLVVGGLARELNGGMVELADGTTQEVDGLQELEIALTAMANAGIKGSEAGTHMRNMLLKLSDPTKEGVTQMEELGIAVFDDMGKMRSLGDIMEDLSTKLGTLTQEGKIQAISALFNSRDLASAEALMAALGDKTGAIATELRNSSVNFGDFVGQTTLLGGTIKDADDAIDEMTRDLLRWSDAGASDIEIQTGLQEAWGLTAEQAQSAMQALTSGLEVASSNASWDKIGEAISQASEQGVLYEGKLYSMAEAQEKFGDSINNAEEGFKILGAAEFMAMQQMDNLDGDLVYLESAFDGLKIAVSDKLTPAFRDFAKFGTESLSSITKGFKEGGLDGAMDAFGDALSNGLSMITDKLPDVINAGMELLGALGQGIIDNAPALFNAFMQVGGMLTEKSLELIQMLADSMATFDWGAAIGRVVDFIVQSFTGDSTTQFLKAGLSIMQSLATGIIQAVPEVARGAIDIMNALTQGIQENLSQMIPVAMNTLMEFSGTLRENVGELVNAGLDMLLSIADGIIQSLPVLIQTIPTIVINIAGIINDNAPKLIVAGIELIGKLVVGIVQAVPTLIAEFPKIIQAIFAVITAINWMSLGAKIVTGIASGVQNLATKIPTALKNIGTKAVEWLKLIQWKTLGKDIIDLIVIGIKGLMNLIPNTLKSIGTLAMKVFKSINWKSLGVHLVEGIWAGISGSLQWIKDRISGWVGDVLSFIKKLFMIESPSKVMRDEVGVYLGKGVAVGIEKSLPDVKDAMSDLEEIATNPIEADFITSIGNGLHNGLNPENENAIINYDELANAIVKAFVKADITVEYDKRELGRLVRRAVTV